MKMLVRAHPQDFVSLILHDAHYLEDITSEMKVRSIEADFLCKADRNGEEIIVHAEFQRRHDPTMGRRMWEYNCVTTFLTRLPVCSFVLYLRKDDPKIPPSENSSSKTFSFLARMLNFDYTAQKYHVLIYLFTGAKKTMGVITTQLLAEIPLFSNMDDEERGELHSLMTERIFQPGQAVMKEGDQGSTFHIIEEGEVEIWIADTDGKKVVLDVFGPGKFFGELSMLSDEIRSASATTAERLVTLELSRDDFFTFLRRRPDAAIDVLTQLSERLKHTDDILRTRVSRNPNEEAASQHISLGQRIADVIAEFSGSIVFLLINLVIFAIWIVANTAGSRIFHFDPYPYQFLTMSVSLEAIFLSIFVLISQNRQAAKDRLKAELDYDVDVKTEMEMSMMTLKIHDIERKLHHIHADLLRNGAANHDHHPIEPPV